MLVQFLFWFQLTWMEGLKCLSLCQRGQYEGSKGHRLQVLCYPATLPRAPYFNQLFSVWGQLVNWEIPDTHHREREKRGTEKTRTETFWLWLRMKEIVILSHQRKKGVRVKYVHESYSLLPLMDLCLWWHLGWLSGQLWTQWSVLEIWTWPFLLKISIWCHPKN